jgi:hypothetical protein
MVVLEEDTKGLSRWCFVGRVPKAGADDVYMKGLLTNSEISISL